MRQDPKKLYAAYGASTDRKAWDGRSMPPYDKLGPQVTAAWTVTALAAAGLDVEHCDAALDRVARELRVDGEVPAAALSLYWTLRTWSRMSASAAEGARAGGPLTADAGALCRALALLGQQTVDALLGPLLRAGEAEPAAAFLQQLGTLGVATGGAGRNPNNLDAPAVILTFERIALAFDHLEDEGQPRVEARLFRAAADLVRRLALAARPPTPEGGPAAA